MCIYIYICTQFAQSCIYNMYCKQCVRIYIYIYTQSMKHQTLANIKTCFRSTGTGVICHQHVRMHTIHITNILCIWSADMMITSWDYIVITGSSKVLAEKVAWLFRLAGPRDVLRGGLSSVQDWEWQQQCSFHLNQPGWDWRIHV